MKRTLIAISLLLIAGLAVGHQDRTGTTDAPKFSVKSIDGKLLSIKNLENDGPFFLYFTRDGDPVSDAARPYFDRMVKAYTPARAKWYGVVGMKQERARAWNAEINPPYKLLLDTNNSVRSLFGVQSYPTIVMINVDGQVVKSWSGFSGYWLKDINSYMATVNHTPKKDFDFTRTPSLTQFGRLD